MSDSHGVFCWYELSTTNPEAARAFYGEVVGFGTKAVPMGPMEYHMWVKPDGEGVIGGVSTLAEEAKAMGAPPNWLIHVRVDDLAATVARCQELGGGVLLPPTEIPGSGHFAILSAFDGAAFGVFSGAQMGPSTGVDSTMGGVAWHEVMTSDVSRALAFYGDLFGWVDAGSMDMGPEGVYQMFGKSADKAWGGMMARPAGMPMSAWLAYFTVPSADEAGERAARMGGKLMHTMDVPGGRIATMCDPQGAAFAVWSGAAQN
ncbi:MAG: VOC family protein [Myxococcales bacterium]|nr:VOC family protein [Myxococcales bacterium]